MIKINIVIDLRAKFEESTYIRSEEAGGGKRKKKKNAHNATSLVETESTCNSKSGIPKSTTSKMQFLAYNSISIV